MLATSATRANESRDKEKYTYLLFSALVLFDYIWVGGEKHLQSLPQCPQLVLQLIRASLVRRPRL